MSPAGDILTEGLNNSQHPFLMVLTHEPLNKEGLMTEIDQNA